MKTMVLVQFMSMNGPAVPPPRVFPSMDVAQKSLELTWARRGGVTLSVQADETVKVYQNEPKLRGAVAVIQTVELIEKPEHL